MKITTNGLVIKEQTTGESDRLVTLLTADYGIVRAFVRRAKLVKSRMASATSLFAYGRFTLYQTRDAYVADDVAPVEVFFELRRDAQPVFIVQLMLVNAAKQSSHTFHLLFPELLTVPII